MNVNKCFSRGSWQNSLIQRGKAQLVPCTVLQYVGVRTGLQPENDIFMFKIMYVSYRYYHYEDLENMSAGRLQDVGKFLEKVFMVLQQVILV